MPSSALHYMYSTVCYMNRRTRSKWNDILRNDRLPSLILHLYSKGSTVLQWKRTLARPDDINVLSRLHLPTPPVTLPRRTEQGKLTLGFGRTKVHLSHEFVSHEIIQETSSQRHNTTRSEKFDSTTMASEKTNSKEIIEKLLGSWIICTLADGRTAEGKLLCVDRLSNIILADCTERRQLRSSDYNEKHKEGDKVVSKEATRQLRQAMVPGNHLVKVEIAEKFYEQAVGELP